jgi:DNA-binding PadR family transcriptional regulator
VVINLTRLMALGTLSGHGQLHGHQIRRIADLTGVGEWGGVSVGALYRELGIMARDGLIRPVRTEQVGRRPARTVYEITSEGRLELEALRERAIGIVGRTQDPLGVALLFTGTGGDREQFVDWLRARRERIVIALEELGRELDRLTAAGYVNDVAVSVMRRGQLHFDAELRWQDEFVEIVAKLPDNSDHGWRIDE